jgi:hypothetical protein
MVTLAATALNGLAGCSAMNKSDEKIKTVQTVLPPGTVGIRNLDQLALSMSSVTGVAMTTQLASQNASIQPWLSTDGQVDSVTPSMLLAITGMAGSFCKAFLANESAAADKDRKAHAGVKFNSGPTAVTVPTLNAVIGTYAKLFWRRAPSTEEIATLNDAYNDAVKALGDVTNTDAARSTATQNALLVPCTAALSSVSFITI